MKHISSSICILALYASIIAGISASEFFVAPNGTPLGNGTRLEPWDISTAFADNTKSQNANYVVKPGDTIWLLGGTYVTYRPSAWPYVVSCKLAGTSSNPIVVRQYPGERAIIDGGINADSGSWTTFWGFEITCSNGRTNLYVNRPTGLSIGGVGQKAINLVIYNTGHPGIASYQQEGSGREIHGCIIWGVGIFEYDNKSSYPTSAITKGSGLYLQNRFNSFSVSDNISGRNLTTGMKAYAENGFVNGFVFDGNITYYNNIAGLMVECLHNSISNSSVINNFDYRSKRNTMGYFGYENLAVHSGLIYSNNYQVINPNYRQAALWLKRWQSVNVLSNTIVTMSPTNQWAVAEPSFHGRGGLFVDLWPKTNVVVNYTINGNSYHGGVELAPPYKPFRYKIFEPQLTFTEWTNVHKIDLSSTYSTNMPSENVVAIRNNKYERGRAHIVVFNWQSNNTVNVNLSNVGLTNGQPFEVRDAQNFLGSPIFVANYQSGVPTIVIPLTNSLISEVTGGIESAYSLNPNAHTASLFNTFVILPRVSQSLPLPPTNLRNRP